MPWEHEQQLESIVPWNTLMDIREGEGGPELVETRGAVRALST